MFDPGLSGAARPRLAAWAAEAEERDPWLHGYWQWDFADGYTSHGRCCDSYTPLVVFHS
jgi:hypothetical protein